MVKAMPREEKTSVLEGANAAARLKDLAACKSR